MPLEGKPAGALLIIAGLLVVALGLYWATSAGGPEGLVEVTISTGEAIEEAWKRANYPGIHPAGALNLGEGELESNVALIGSDGTIYILRAGNSVLCKASPVRPTPLMLLFEATSWLAGVLLALHSRGVRLPPRVDAWLLLALLLLYALSIAFSVLYPARSDLSPSDLIYLQVEEYKTVEPGVVVVSEGDLVSPERVSYEKVFNTAVGFAVARLGVFLAGPRGARVEPPAGRGLGGSSSLPSRRGGELGSRCPLPRLL